MASMADDPDNIVLVYLRRIDAKVDGLKDEMVQVKERLHSVEEQVAGLRKDFVRLEHRIDGLDIAH